MAGRPRRVRILAVAIVIAALLLLYHRNSQQVERYASYLEDAVGGGAVLRQTIKPDAVAAAATTTTTTQPFTPADIAPTTSVSSAETTSKVAWTASTSTPPVSPTEDFDVDLPDPDTTDAPKSTYQPALSTSTKPAEHWSKQSERYPVSSTIQLPTGTLQPIPRIQTQAKGGADLERLAIIKDAAKHAWGGYWENARGFDEIQPVTGRPKNTFNGWGATLVDSLDTLWIMGMKQEFEDAVAEVENIDFTTSPRNDIPLFEVTIRYLGGLIAAYDVSGHQYSALLDKAVELAEILFSAFDTPNRMPMTFYYWKPTSGGGAHLAGRRVVLAELGTLSLEFTRLAQLTGEAKYYDAIARITDAFELWQNDTRVPGMWPTSVDASGCQKPAKVASDLDNGLQLLVPDTSGTAVANADPFKTYQGMVGAPPPAYDTKEEGEDFSDTVVERVRPAEDGFGLHADLRSPMPKRHKRQLDEAPPPSSQPGTTWDDVPHHSQVESSPHDGLHTTSDNQQDSHSPAFKDALHKALEMNKCIPQGLASSSLNAPETFSLGGASDSTYEYLPKEWLLLGGRVDQYKEMFLASMKPIVDQLLFRPMIPDELDILISGDLHTTLVLNDDGYRSTLVPVQGHLTCFVGGMFALGGKIFNQPEHVELGRKITEGCIWSYNSTASGIMPEAFETVPCASRDVCPWNETLYWEVLDPYAETRLMEAHYEKPPTTVRKVRPPPTGDTNAAAKKQFRPYDTHEAPGAAEEVEEAQEELSGLHRRDVETEGSFADLDRTQAEEVPPAAAPRASPSSSSRDVVRASTQSARVPAATPKRFEPLSHEEFVASKIRRERLPPGFTAIKSAKYILRPEAIESVFYMYRITGEQYWRDAGWKMFLAIDRATRTTYGHGYLDDVLVSIPLVRDGMESFWLAETLKYFYLLFDDPETWSLDDWVLNTEAHFFQRPENPSSRAVVEQR